MSKTPRESTERKSAGANQSADARQNKDAVLYGLPPVVGISPRVLILGSMPGAESLRLGQYYAYRFNRFWPILFRFFEGLTGVDAVCQTDYAERKKLAQAHGVALWDTFRSCRRADSSLDSKIKDETVNDIPGFLAEYPTVQTIFVNGKKSETGFKAAFPSLDCTVLPSTSPANAAYSLDGLYGIWSAALCEIFYKSRP